MDESSNSGQNLLDPDQPVFTVAGVHVTDEVAKSIVDEVQAELPPTQKEAKYGSLARSSRGRKALLHAFEQLPAGSIRSYVVNKRFMVTAKLIDILLEPMAHATGFNMYEDRQALALAELLHVCGPVLGNATAYGDLLQTFVDWVRQRATTDALFVSVAAYKETLRHPDLVEWFDLLEHSRNVAEETAEDIATGKQRDLLDPAVPSLYCLGTNFGESLGQFRLIHDESKVINRNAVLLRLSFLFPDPARPGHFLERLPADRIDFADSRDHPQLQLADWAAGAVRQWAANLAVGGGDQFSRDLEDVARPWVIGSIWPSAPGSSR